ncbi:hypothetical protein [Actinoplanes sp. NPDC049802]|uniref:hypothetical protein n=1 Tax=Actinoplanes sp. NPDC049802 TaxID=3154742 RepID=UPI0033CEE69B
MRHPRQDRGPDEDEPVSAYLMIGGRLGRGSRSGRSPGLGPPPNEATAKGDAFVTATLATYDEFGRAKTATDAGGGTARTTCTVTNGLITRIDTENALRQTSWTRYTPEWGNRPQHI